MPVGNYDSDVKEIDALLAEAKRVDGPQPQWIPGSHAGELQATWAIADSVGILRAEFRFRCPRIARAYPSVSLVFRKRPIWRVDMVAQSECKLNPIGAAKLALPAQVCGPHEHAWPDNRDYARLNGPGAMPMRRPLPPQVRRLPQVIAYLASAANVDLGPDGRGFDVPLRTDLFEEP